MEKDMEFCKAMSGATMICSELANYLNIAEGVFGFGC